MIKHITFGNMLLIRDFTIITDTVTTASIVDIHIMYTNNVISLGTIHKNLNLSREIELNKTFDIQIISMQIVISLCTINKILNLLRERKFNKIFNCIFHRVIVIKNRDRRKPFFDNLFNQPFVTLFFNEMQFK